LPFYTFLHELETKRATTITRRRSSIRHLLTADYVEALESPVSQTAFCGSLT
jgi:hypothetical protein